MPKFIFRCASCSEEIMQYVSVSTLSITCKCGSDMSRLIPKLAGHVQVKEVVDKYRNVSHRQDQKEILEDRNSVHHWSVDVPKMVASGTYCLETMLENRWVYYNDKGELCVRTKPPESE